MIQKMKKIKQSKLSPNDRDFYDENGYLVKKCLINAEQLNQVKVEIEGLHQRMANQVPDGVGISWEEHVHGEPDKPKYIRQLMNSEVISEGLNEILRSNEVLDVVESLIGPNISLFHSKLLMKAAKRGTITPWHQDYSYWRNPDNQPLMINCMLSIDEANSENGCIRFVPGSHKGELLVHDQAQTSFGLFLPGFFEARDDAVVVETEPGDCVFFGPLIIHGSSANQSLNHRRANTFAYNVTENGMQRPREVLRTKFDTVKELKE